jgi:two-component system NtrC family sensor kinase
VTVSPDAVFAPGRRMVRGAALAGGLMLLLALIAGTWAAAQATAPLSELAAASRRLADGDWSVSTVARTGDEIEELARDFSAMAAALRDKEARVLEQQHLLHRSERLAVLGRFAAEVAHEVGNPLAAMKASLQALQEESQSIPPEDPRFEQLVRQIDRLDRILRGLLRSARRAPAEGATCDVGETVRAVGALLQAQAARAGVTLAVDAPVPSRAAMDGEQLQQVVFNLVANALDATKPGGRVTVAAGERDGSVELTVADNGRGIPEEDRARLFEPFFTTRPDGTGLGLAVAEQIVRENGGRLIVDSTVGIGSTFTVALPRATGEG